MKQLTWQTIALILVLAATTVALATLTSWGAPEIVALVAVLAGPGAATAVGGAATAGMQQRVDAIHAETAAQTATLEQVASRVNGELDGRIAAAMEDAAETGSARTLAELRRQGVIS